MLLQWSAWRTKKRQAFPLRTCQCCLQIMSLLPGVHLVVIPLNEPGLWLQDSTAPCAKPLWEANFFFSAFLVSGLHMGWSVSNNCPTATCVTPFALWLWKSSQQDMELTPSPLEPGLALWLTLQQKWQWPDPSLSLKQSCALLLTPGTPHLLWGQASGRQRQHGAKLSYPSWNRPRVANPYPTCLLTTNA